MTSVQIETLANMDGVAGDLDIKTLLRTECIMEFFNDVGDVRWRRVNTTLAITAPTRQYDLADDFGSMIDIKVPPAGSVSLCANDSLLYIGEDSNLTLQAEFATTATRPLSYYIVPRTSGSTFRAIKFQAPTDAAYTAYYVYLKSPVFADYTTSVDMSKWVPEMLQPALVKCLRRAILLDRYGQNDRRFSIADGQYREWVQRAIDSKDLAPRNFAVFVN